MASVFDDIHAESTKGGNVFDQIHAEAQPQAKSVGGFIDNVVSSGGDMLKGMAGAVMHPQDTFHGVQQVVRGLADKATDAAESLGLPKDPGRPTPVQPEAADALIGRYKERYGSIAGIGDALYKDPVGVALDASMALGGASSAAKVAGLSKLARVAEVVNPANVAGKVAGAAVKGAVNLAAGGDAPAILRASAEQNFYRALNPMKDKNKALTAKKVAPGLVDRGVVATSIEDLRKQAAGHLEDLGGKIDDAVDAAAKQDVRIGPDPLIKELQGHIEDAKVGNVVPVASKAYVSKLQDFQQELRDIAAANGGTIPAVELRKLRQINDAVVARSKGGFALPPDELGNVDAMSKHANGMRAAIATALPDLAEINKEFSFWKDVDKVADATSLRRVGQRTPLTDRMFQGAGATIGASVAGPKGAIIGAEAGGRLSRLQHSMVWNSVNAAAKMKVAALMEAGDTAGAMELANQAAKDVLSGGKKLLEDNTGSVSINGKPLARDIPHEDAVKSISDIVENKQEHNYYGIRVVRARPGKGNTVKDLKVGATLAEDSKPLSLKEKSKADFEAAKGELDENINRRNRLYHATDANSAVKILDSGEIKPYLGDSSAPSAHDPTLGVSTSRVPRIGTMPDKAVSFVLDPAATPKTRPYADIEGGHGKTKGDWMSSKFEHEQRTFDTAVPIDAAKGILIDRSLVNDPKILESIRRKASELKIPVYEFPNGKMMNTYRNKFVKSGPIASARLTTDA